MAWCRPGDKPLSVPMMIILLTHICVTCPQWVKAVWHIYVCVSLIWVIIGSGSGLMPVWCQAITWTNDDLWSVGPSRTIINEISVSIRVQSFYWDHFTRVYFKPVDSDHCKSAAIWNRLTIGSWHAYGALSYLISQYVWQVGHNFSYKVPKTLVRFGLTLLCL